MEKLRREEVQEGEASRTRRSNEEERYAWGDARDDICSASQPATVPAEDRRRSAAPALYLYTCARSTVPDDPRKFRDGLGRYVGESSSRRTRRHVIAADFPVS